MSGAPQPDAAAQGVRDAGLQAERTALAWTRTALALFVNALLALRAGWSHDHVVVTALGAALLVAAAAAAACGAWRRRCLLSRHPSIAAPSIVIAATTIATFVACGVALASVLALR